MFYTFGAGEPARGSVRTASLTSNWDREGKNNKICGV